MGIHVVYCTRGQQGKSCNIPVSRTLTKKNESLAGYCEVVADGGILDQVVNEKICQLLMKRQKQVWF